MRGGLPTRLRVSINLPGIITTLFTPALVSLAVSLWVNRRAEAHRARRDHITKLFEVTREDVRRSVESAIDYFATRPESRTPLQEAKVLLAEREIRSALSVILGPHPELQNDGSSAAQAGRTEFLAELTGGNFQVLEGEVDKEHIRRLTHAGAGLRSALARMRDAELRMLLDKDPLLGARDWLMIRLDRFFGLGPPPKTPS